MYICIYHIYMLPQTFVASMQYTYVCNIYIYIYIYISSAQPASLWPRGPYRAWGPYSTPKPRSSPEEVQRPRLWPLPPARSSKKLPRSTIL